MVCTWRLVVDLGGFIFQQDQTMDALLIISLCLVCASLAQEKLNETLIYHWDIHHKIYFYCQFGTSDEVQNGGHFESTCFYRNKGVQHTLPNGVKTYPYLAYGSPIGFVLKCADIPNARMHSCNKYVYSQCKYTCPFSDVVHEITCELRGPPDDVIAVWSEPNPCFETNVDQSTYSTTGSPAYTTYNVSTKSVITKGPTTRNETDTMYAKPSVLGTNLTIGILASVTCLLVAIGVLFLLPCTRKSKIFEKCKGKWPWKASQNDKVIFENINADVIYIGSRSPTEQEALIDSPESEENSDQDASQRSGFFAEPISIPLQPPSFSSQFTVPPSTLSQPPILNSDITVPPSTLSQPPILNSDITDPISLPLQFPIFPSLFTASRSTMSQPPVLNSGCTVSTLSKTSAQDVGSSFQNNNWPLERDSVSQVNKVIRDLTANDILIIEALGEFEPMNSGRSIWDMHQD